jgi:hypothetical protein
MATYKVIQDIEADDKLFGPLSLKQFIFAGAAAGLSFLAFLVATKISPYAAIPLIPFILVPAILAAPLGRDQPTEVWLAAQIRFFLKPRKRIWDQAGLKELVTITVPKKLEHLYTDGLTQQQVRNRLNALADTIDSRGWAVKHANLNIAAEPAYAGGYSDRLIDPISLPQSVPEINVTAADDILDAANNPTAQHFEQMVQASGQAQKTAAIARMDAARQVATAQPPVDYSFITGASNAPVAAGQAVFTDDPVIAPGQPQAPQTFVDTTQASTSGTDAEQALLDKIHQEKQVAMQNRNPHHKTIKTAEELALEAAEQRKDELAKAQAVTPPPNPVNIELAKDAGDLKIATIAGMAKNKIHANPNEGEIRIQH